MKKISTTLALFLFLGISAFAQKPVLNISIKAYVEQKTVAYYGGLAAIKDSINLQFQKINAAYNADARFTHTYNYTVGAFQVYNNDNQFYAAQPWNGEIKLIDSTRYYQFLKPEEGNNVVRVVYDAFPRISSFSLNGTQTVDFQFKQNRDNQGSIFSNRLNRSIVHEFGHVRGQVDLYNGKLKAQLNLVDTLRRYENGYNSIMNNCYNETGFDPITIGILNRNASLYGNAYIEGANKVESIKAFFPNTVQIRVKDALGNPINNAQVKLYGAAAYIDRDNGRISTTPTYTGSTNSSGLLSYVGREQNPFNLNTWAEYVYSTFYVEVSFNGQTRYGWLSHVDAMHAKATGNDTYTLDIALPAGTIQPAHVAPIVAWGISGGCVIYKDSAIAVGVSVADPDGFAGNATVRIFKNGAFAGNAEYNARDKYFWYFISDNNTAGENTISVEVRDEKGALSSNTDVAKYVVIDPAQAIKVAIVSPLNNASVSVGAVVPLSARFSSAVKTIARISYYNGSTLLGSSNIIPFGINWTPTTPGNYSITAVAFDSSGFSKTSAPINVTVIQGCTEPAYNAATAYNGGQKVSYNNIVYTANWWTQGAQPDLNSGAVGTGKPWTQTGTCQVQNVVPTVTVTSPTEGQVLTLAAGQKVNFTVTTTPSVVDSVKYILVDVVCNGPGCTTVRRFTQTTAPYSLSVDPIAGAVSSQVNVVAYKNGRASDVTPALNYSVVVPVKPVVTITSPTQSSVSYQYPSDGNLTTINLGFNVATSAIDSVRFTVIETKCDGPGCTVIRNATVKTAPFAYAYLPTLKYNGYTQVQVVAFSKGLASDVATTTYNVKPLPEVFFVTPVNNSSVTRSVTSIPVSVTVNSANLAIDSVVYFISDFSGFGQTTSVIDSKVVVKTSPFGFNLPVRAGQNYTRITAVAFGDGGKNSRGLSTQVYYNDAPVVTITAPTVGTKFNVGGAVTVSANVTDDVVVSKVEIYSPHITNSTVTLTAAPYTATFSNLLSSGNRGLTTFIVKATDNTGAVTVQTIDVAENKLPVIAVTSPVAVNGINPKYLVGGAITVSANVTDQDGTISKVEITRGATNTGLVTLTAAPFTTTYTNLPAPQPDGSYSFTVKAYDNNGGVSSQLIIVYKNRVPSTTISTPANNAIYNTGANIVIGALPFDPDFTSGKIEYFNGATKLGEVVVNGLLSGSAYNYTWLNVANGTYTITAKTTDDLGESGVSAPVTVIVKTPNVTCTAPVYNPATAYTGGQSVQYNGIKYTANWWTQGAQPDLNNGAVGTGKPWTSNGTCTSRVGDNVVVASVTSIYPNPTTGSFTIETETEASAVILNAFGKEVATLSLVKGQNEVNLSLASGVYFVKINNNVTKLVIE